MSPFAFDPHAKATSIVDRGRTRNGIEQLRRQWPADEPTAAVVIVHGLGEHSGRYEHVGRQLADGGLYTVAFDQRGFGATGGTRAYIDSFDRFLDDVEDALAEVRRLGLPTVLLGHSMGGLVSISYVLHDRPAPDMLVLSAPALGAETPAWMRRAVGPLSRVAPRLRQQAPIDPDTLSRDPRVGADYEADPLVERSATVRLGHELLSTMEWCRRRIDELDVPTLLLHGGDDLLVPTGATEILHRVPGVERRVIAGARHEVFNEPDGPDAVADVIDWIDRVRLAGRGSAPS